MKCLSRSGKSPPGVGENPTCVRRNIGEAIGLHKDHFSNGASFGVMYLAIIGSASRRHWAWAVLFALALELGMLFTPYSRVFGIDVTTRFVLVTIAAHAVFGVGLGFAVGWLSRCPVMFPNATSAAPA